MLKEKQTALPPIGRGFAALFRNGSCSKHRLTPSLL
ncbi:hypothetical protein GGR07_002094 [Bacteroides pyogenes]|nr:hypothetical protein [Bacteroides pyogenes]SUV31416.1 Uncharacterised protein [Bacteroides pyogenes]